MNNQSKYVFTIFLLGLLNLDLFAEVKGLPLVYITNTKKVEISSHYTYPAMPSPLIQMNLLSEEQGFIEKLVPILGTDVRKGQVLAKIKRLDPLYKYQNIIIEAPISGVVSKIYVRQGGNVAKGDKVLEIIDPTKIFLSIEISSKDRRIFNKGDKGFFSWKNHKYPVTIAGISPIIDPLTGTLSAHLEVDDLKDINHKEIPLGQLGQVTFETNKRNNFLIRASAVVYIGLVPHLRVVDKKSHKVDKVPISIGESIGDDIEVIDGVSEDEWVVIQTASFLKAGEEVLVKNLPQSNSKEGL